MSQVRDKNFSGRRASERGGARLNFLIVAAAFAAIAYAGYQFIPVAFQASQLKAFMQDTVDNAAITGKNVQWAEEQLRKNLAGYGAPPNARISVENNNARIEAHVQYAVPIPLFVMTYQYTFDYTARSNNFLSGG